jgi:hypothetical protein
MEKLRHWIKWSFTLTLPFYKHSGHIFYSYNYCICRLKPVWTKGKGKVHPYKTLALGGGGWSAPRPGRFTPAKDPVPIVQEAGWAPGPVWTCAKNLAPTRIWSPDCPAHSQSLYWLSYPATVWTKKCINNRSLKGSDQHMKYCIWNWQHLTVAS